MIKNKFTNKYIESAYNANMSLTDAIRAIEDVNNFIETKYNSTLIQSKLPNKSSSLTKRLTNLSSNEKQTKLDKLLDDKEIGVKKLHID